VSGEISGMRVDFLARDLLIKNKLALDRPKDRADVDALQKTGPKIS
jgi:hypothetical protein